MDIKNLYNDSQYWYIAFCITPWHLMGVKTFVKCKLEETPELQSKFGAVVILPHPRTGYCVNESYIHELDIPCLKTVICSEQDSNKITKKFIPLFFRNLVNYRKEVLSERFILSTLEPYAFCEVTCFDKLKNTLVLIDEGVSSYISLFEYVRHSYIETHSRKYEVKLSLRLIISSFLIKTYAINIIDWFLFDKENNYRVNEKVVKYYKAQYKKAENIINIACNSILYLSQPPVTEQEKIILPQFISKLASICARKGITLYVKPHPRDMMDDFENINGVKVLKQAGSVEVLFSQLCEPPLYVVGFRSTALLTLKAFYNVECISVIKLLKYEYHKSLNSDDYFFYRSFRSHIDFSENFDDIDCLLTRKLQEING